MKDQKRVLMICLLFIFLQCCIFLNGCENAPSQLSESTADTGPTDMPYELYEENGTHYLRFTDVYIPEQYPDMCVYPHIKYPEFSSVEDMKTKIRTGNIPEERLRSLYAYSDTDTIEIININEIRDVKLPDEMICERILWYGDSYSFELTSNTVTGAVHIATQEEYDYYSQIHLTLNEYQTIISEEQVADRNAKITLFKNSTGEYKDISYQLQDGTRMISVVEHYTLKHIDEWSDVSETIPDRIAFFVEDGPTLYRAILFDFEERPSVDWLLSFELQEE